MTNSIDAGGNGILSISWGHAGGGGFAIWDGPAHDIFIIDGTGLGGIDLTSSGVADAILVRVLSASMAFNFELYAYSGSNQSTAYVPVPGSIEVPQVISIPFSAFTADIGTGADFTNLGALLFGVTRSPFGPVTGNVQIDYVATVPEPSGLALVLAASVLTPVVSRFVRRGSASLGA